jgi:Cys-tRNA(Pro) deacylase
MADSVPDSVPASGIDDTIPPVSRALAAQGIPHTLFVHIGPVHSLEQAAAERGQEPGQVVRSILFRLEDGQYALVLVAGPAQVSWPALRRHFGRSRLTMAAADEVLAVTGYPIGAVGPLGLATALPVLVDETVLAQEEVSMGSGVRGTAVVLKVADLLTALDGPEIVRVVG